ncbi:MAG: FecCD family ABC transporter permease [candidate division WOR-3 bacterium]|jgi:iron complex transport system permease protein
MNLGRKCSGWLVLFTVFLISTLLSVLIGPGGFSLSGLDSILYFRLPRLSIGILAGGVLAVVGGAFQGLMRNPLVDPWTLGVASGAALGVSMAVISGLQTSVMMPVTAFIGGALAIAIVYLLAGSGVELSVTRLVLAGVIVNFFFSSLVMLVMVLGHHTLGEAIYLMMGHLGVVFTRRSAGLLIGSAVIALAGCGWLIFHSRELDIISLNEEVAISLGVDAERLMRRVFLVGSLAVGLVVAWSGAISFVGLVVPHLVRMFFGPKHSQVLPGSFVLGAGLLLLADVLVRGLSPAGLPLSVVTALIGVPFFIYLLRKNR